MYKYKIYGLGISSRIKFYNLKEEDIFDTDVNVYKREPETWVSEDINKGITSAMGKDYAWFINAVGVFVIKNGNEIYISPSSDDVTDEELGSFILGWGISYIFKQRGMSAIHSTAICIADSAILISGVSGSGKSTTALELIKRGYKYLTDDISMIDIKKDMLVYPGFPVQKVCRDVADKMNTEKLHYIDERKDKFAYNNTEEFCDEPKKFKVLYVLFKYDGEAVKVEEPKGLDKWNLVANSLFLLDAYQCMAFPMDEKQRCLEIAGRIKAYKIYRPATGNTVNEICDLIERLSIED